MKKALIAGVVAAVIAGVYFGFPTFVRLRELASSPRAQWDSLSDYEHRNLEFEGAISIDLARTMLDFRSKGLQQRSIPEATQVYLDFTATVGTRKSPEPIEGRASTYFGDRSTVVLIAFADPGSFQDPNSRFGHGVQQLEAMVPDLLKDGDQLPVLEGWERQTPEDREAEQRAAQERAEKGAQGAQTQQPVVPSEGDKALYEQPVDPRIEMMNRMMRAREAPAAQARVKETPDEPPPKPNPATYFRFETANSRGFIAVWSVSRIRTQMDFLTSSAPKARLKALIP
jgi:hypothetical protein